MFLNTLLVKLFHNFACIVIIIALKLDLSERKEKNIRAKKILSKKLIKNWDNYNKNSQILRLAIYFSNDIFEIKEIILLHSFNKLF